jgi:hypothetical protein
MSIKEFTIVIDSEYPIPKIFVKIEKGNGSFLYCVVLYILEGEETKEICHYDNYHHKGDHCHFLNKDGEEIKQEKFKYESVGKIIEDLSADWKNIMEGAWKNG